MEAKDNFDCLSIDFKAQLPNLKVSRWEHFASFTLEQLLKIPSITLEDLKVISRRLQVNQLGMEVPKIKRDEYYLLKANMTYNEVLKEQQLEVSIEVFFERRSRILNALKQAKVNTVRDLTSLTIFEICKLKGIGTASIMEIQYMVTKNGFRFARGY